METMNLKEWCELYNRRYILKEWDEKENKKKPEDVPWNCRNLFHYICQDCGHKWAETLDQRTSSYYPTKCPKCSDRLLPEGTIDKSLYGRCRELVEKRWDKSGNEKLDPKKLSFSSTEEASWICPKCGKIYRAQINVDRKSVV